jgi:predicted TIM-barrel fold metal-dependent hydrolase
VVFPFPLAEVDPDLANGYVMQAWRRYPDRIIPFALLDDRPEHWIDQGFRGFKQHFLLEPERFRLERIYPVIADAGLPLMAHFPTFRIVECALQVLGHAPGIKLIIAHFGRCKPDTGDCVAENIDKLCAFPQVFFESSTVKDACVLAAAIGRVGVDRVCFGSDLPFGSKHSDNPQAVELEVIRTAMGNGTGLDRILSGTILELVGEH